MNNFQLILSFICLNSIIFGKPLEKWSALSNAVEKAGGVIQFDESGNPTSLDMYNGNNPLKGRGGKNTAVNDEWLTNIRDVKSLKTLSLSNCDITDAGMEHVGTLTNLANLNLPLTAITDGGFVHLGKLTKLQSIGMASAKSTGAGFRYLKVKNIESTNFHFTPLNDEGLEAICKVGVTGRFWFAHAHFTDEGAKHLSKLTKLKVLGIGSTEKSSSGESIAHIVNLPLEDLSLLDKQADSVGVKYAAQIKTLKKLDISYAPSLQDSDLQNLSTLPNLEQLRIGGSKDITDEGIAAFRECRSLKQLTLQRLKNVTPEAVKKLQQSLPDTEIILK